MLRLLVVTSYNSPINLVNNPKFVLTHIMWHNGSYVFVITVSCLATVHILRDRTFRDLVWFPPSHEEIGNTLLVYLEERNPIPWTCTLSETLCSLEYRIVSKVKKYTSPEC
jgi:hypothetical protein